MRVLLIVLSLIIGHSAYSQEAFSLVEAQEFGIANNEKVKNAGIDLQIAKRKIRETTGIGLPHLSGTVDFNHFLDIPTTVVPAKTFNPLAPEGEIAELKFGSDFTANAGLQLSQIIFNGNYLVGLQAAKAYANTSEVLIEKSIIDVKYDVAEAYHTVLMLKDNAASLKESYQNMSDLLQHTNILIEEHMVEAIQGAQLELTMLQIQNGSSTVESQMEVAKNLLKMQMGMDLSIDIELSDNLLQFMDLSLLLEEEYNPKQHIAHRMLNTQLVLNQLNLKNKKANYLPTLSVFLSHKQSAQRYDFDFFDGSKDWYPTTLWGANLSIPIFNGGMTKAQVDQAELEVLKTENTITQTDRALELQMKQAATNYKNAITTYNTQLRAVEVAKLIIDNTVIKYKLGSVMSLELTQMESQYLNTKSALNTAVYSIVKARNEIEKITKQ